MSQLTVIRASAGSGKTHALTGYYLNLLLSHRDDYFRSILAVTFTNKATSEMKERIIAELFRLASGAESNFLGDLQKSLKEDASTIRSKAARVINSILHDYSWFSIETIDSFFQRIIRSFSRELGVPGNYSIELNTDEVLEYAVDHLIEDAANDEQLQEWLTQFAFEKIQEGKSWDFRNDLIGLGKQLFNEAFSARAEKFMEVLSDYDSLKTLRNQWQRQKVAFEKQCHNFGTEALQQIEEAGLSQNDFAGKSRGAMAIFKNIAIGKFRNTKKEFISEQTLVINLLSDIENWPHNSSKNKAEVLALASSKLQNLLQQAIAYIQENYSNYCTLQALLPNLYPLGILVKLSEQVKAYRFEKNTFILSDAPALIYRLIRENDTPFLYEKMGNRYRNFLIDEFQDTSALQWSNFKPLIENALAQTDSCLLVGDVKQSIYRWRNGDWDILARQVQEGIHPEMLQLRQLETNWRSCPEVVGFNNALFPNMLNRLHAMLDEQFAESGFRLEQNLNLLKAIYNDVEQHCAQKETGRGNIRIKFLDEETTKEEPEEFTQHITDSINSLLDQQYQPGDIAVLVRSAADGRKIADLLIEKNSAGVFPVDIQVISNESLFLTASQSVQLLVAAMEYLFRPSESFYRYKLAALAQATTEVPNASSRDYLQQLPLFDGLPKSLPEEIRNQQDVLRSLPLYELAERLAALFNLNSNSRELPYLHAFLDVVHEFTQVNPGNLSHFLEFWKDEGMKKSLSVSDSQNAIRILTMHKSKGLEFRGVLIPYCSWDLDQKTGSLLWADLPEGDYGGLPAYPISYSSALIDTRFAELYHHEKFRAHVDNLNLLYVAITRAVESLIVFAEIKNLDEAGGIKTTGDLLYQSIYNSDNNILKQHFDAEIHELCIGFNDRKPRAESESLPEETYIQATQHEPAMDRLFFSSQAMEYFQENYSALVERKLRGKVLHALLANITTANDINTAVGKAVYEGHIDLQEGIVLQQHIESCLKKEQVAHWFDGTGNVMNEAELLLTRGTTRRPDRVIIWKDEVHVIDYKFGSDQAELSHHKQVHEYMTLLMKMGYQQVKGFLWYLDLNEVVPVL